MQCRKAKAIYSTASQLHDAASQWKCILNPSMPWLIYCILWSMYWRVKVHHGHYDVTEKSDLACNFVSDKDLFCEITVTLMKFSPGHLWCVTFTDVTSQLPQLTFYHLKSNQFILEFKQTCAPNFKEIPLGFHENGAYRWASLTLMPLATAVAATEA